MIFSYHEQSKQDFSEKHRHEPVNYISKEEWLRLVHFDIDGISSISKDEIH
jgi:hypothetical protein